MESRAILLRILSVPFAKEACSTTKWESPASFAHERFFTRDPSDLATTDQKETCVNYCLMPEEASGTEYLFENELNPKAIDYLINEGAGWKEC